MENANEKQLTTHSLPKVVYAVAAALEGVHGSLAKYFIRRRANPHAILTTSLGLTFEPATSSHLCRGYS